MKKDLITRVTGTVLITCMYFLVRSAPSTSMYQTSVLSSSTMQLSMNAFQGRVEVKIEDLPEKVRNTLNDKSYAGWTIIEAFLITNEDNSQYYELVVRRADERTRMKVDANGNVLN